MLSGLEPAQMPADAIEVGRIQDAWGVKGWFKVLPFSSNPEALFSSKKWYLLPSDRGEKSFIGCALLSIKESKEHSDSVVACAREFNDRNAAESLRGARIFVSRSSFPTPGADEYYWVDLIGLQVFNRGGELMGVVKELLSTGPQTVMVLEYQLDQKSMERMIPFVSAYVDEVSLKSGRILVDWQADY